MIARKPFLLHIRHFTPRFLHQKYPKKGYPDFQRVYEVGLQTGSKLPGCESQAMSGKGLLCCAFILSLLSDCHYI